MKTILRNPARGAAQILFVFWLLAAWAFRGEAQTPGAPPAPAYKVGTITVKFVGVANVDEQVVRANMEVHEGGPLDESMIDHDIRSLYKTGLFEYIEVKREIQPDGVTVNLVVELTPKYRVRAIQFEGNKRVKIPTLRKQIKTQDGAVANTACLGFGMERVCMALFKHHGFDPKKWPAAVREKLWP